MIMKNTLNQKDYKKIDFIFRVGIASILFSGLILFFISLNDFKNLSLFCHSNNETSKINIFKNKMYCKDNEGNLREVIKTNFGFFYKEDFEKYFQNKKP
ncbi:MAG: hypothetical protein KatS3mg096_702 [Candidatus Parcubacteria bacterium]|nr:MAG: hypothetical protein KatS3mg096_675 [Candidatus Parcubacteria bacterium]GIW67834.1 MAG: hypothetical protein KatS3mg096_702 [Candidatus Parcubacteria bacterium]